MLISLSQNFFTLDSNAFRNRSAFPRNHMLRISPRSRLSAPLVPGPCSHASGRRIGTYKRLSVPVPAHLRRHKYAVSHCPQSESPAFHGGYMPVAARAGRHGCSAGPARVPASVCVGTSRLGEIPSDNLSYGHCCVLPWWECSRRGAI